MSEQADEVDGSAPASGEKATWGTRVIGFGLFAGAIAAAARVATDGAGGDWRSGVIVAGLAGSLLLGGLALNGWLARVVGALLWIFPATLVFTGLVLVLDPGYGTFLNGDAERGRIESDGQAIGIAVVLLIAGLAGLVGYGFAVRKRLSAR
ncbi:hypothetical protein [Actinomadura sp. CNU-125]|uniref:hypothetical protein n=1 Tax=Actinomadura sp. CNU-125 TaxID=1904961 RepID=UPI0011786C48|nr:hypothetical protein [Actinomadura sp. CNU-125]